MNIHTKFNEIVEEYQGTCNFLSQEDEQFLEEHDLFQKLDDQIFNCVNCGWWCEIHEEVGSEFTGEMICSDCWDD